LQRPQQVVSKEIFRDLPGKCYVLPQARKANRDIKDRSSRRHAEIYGDSTLAGSIERYKVDQAFPQTGYQGAHTLFSLQSCFRSRCKRPPGRTCLSAGAERPPQKLPYSSHCCQAMNESSPTPEQHACSAKSIPKQRPIGDGHRPTFLRRAACHVCCRSWERLD